MSHLKQRKEKQCLNCNAAINGRYCSVCGQENIEPQESVWHLIVHTFNDITHFDGKFFYSLKYLIKKPGFLSSEYMAGRRMSYLNPIRFYIFTSFIFFFILFTFFLNGGNDKIEIIHNNFSAKDSLKQVNKYLNKGIDSLLLDSIIKKSGIDSVPVLLKAELKKNDSGSIFRISDYRDRKQFDSLDKLKKIDENFASRFFTEKQFYLQEKYANDPEKAKEAFYETLKHLVPQVLLISLPFFAILLKVLYFRRRKYYYTAHIIFTIHFYIFLYIQLLFIYISVAISHINYFHFMKVVTAILILGIFYYLYKAMRNFYEQSTWKTILKFILLIFALLFLILFFTVLLMGLTIFKI